MKLVRTTLAALAMSAAAAASALAVPVTFDPSAALGIGTAFTFDALIGTEVSRIDTVFGMTGNYNSTEHGYLYITGAKLGGSPFVPAGLGSVYTLYFDFSDTAAGASIAVPGTVTSATMTLYAVSGASTFGTPGGVATVDNHGNIPVALYGTTFVSGDTSATPVSLTPLALDLSAHLLARVDPLLPGFIVSPGTLVSLLTAFHDSSGVDIQNGGTVFVLNGGDDVITFTIPEPASLALASWANPPAFESGSLPQEVPAVLRRRSVG